MINPTDTLYWLKIIISWYRTEFFLQFRWSWLNSRWITQKKWIWKFPGPSLFTILHIDHNVPCLSRRILHNHCFQYLLGITVVPGQIEKEGYAELLGVNNVHLGLYENGEFRTTGSPCGGRTSWQTRALGFSFIYLSFSSPLLSVLG